MRTMMSLDEAILHAEEVAIEQERLMGRYDAASGYARSGNESIRTESAKKCEQCAAEHRQLAAWLRELQETRKERDYWQEKANSYEQTIYKLTDSISKQPEIVRCGECTHYIPILSNWGKCGVHSSPTEKYRTCQICDYCSWAEKKEDKSQYIKNKLSTL